MNLPPRSLSLVTDGSEPEGQHSASEYGYLRWHYGVAPLAGQRITVLGRPAIVLPEGDLARYLFVRFEDTGQESYLHPIWGIDYAGGEGTE